MTSNNNLKKTYICFWILFLFISLLFLTLSYWIGFGYVLGFTLGALISFLFIYIKDTLSNKILLNTNKKSSITIIYFLFFVDLIVIAFISFLVFKMNAKIAQTRLEIALYPYNIFCYLGGLALFHICVYIAYIPFEKIFKKKVRKEVIIDHK